MSQLENPLPEEKHTPHSLIKVQAFNTSPSQATFEITKEQKSIGKNIGFIDRLL